MQTNTLQVYNVPKEIWCFKENLDLKVCRFVYCKFWPIKMRLILSLSNNNIVLKKNVRRNQFSYTDNSRQLI